MKSIARITLALAATALAGTALAKLPPLNDEAKAKAAEAAAKTAHGNKVANYQLCKSMDKVATQYFAQAKKDGKTIKPAEKTEACADPGPFVYTPAPPAPAAAPAAAAPATPATTAQAAPAKK
jgi:Tfp pilus assembly major pilin PilA